MKTVPVSIKLSQAIQGFFLVSQARGLSVHTVADYKNTITKFQRYLERDPMMDQITPAQIAGFLAAQLDVTNKTKLNYYVGLCALWTWAKREKLVQQHAPHEVPAPKAEQREIQPYNESDIRALLNHLARSKRYSRPGKKVSDHALPYAERNRAIILLLVDTGIRAEELCSIRIHQVDKRNQRILIHGKGAKERHVAFSARTHQALWRYLTTRPDHKETDPLFVVDSGWEFTRDRLLDLLQTIGARAGVKDVTVHRFRHTFAIQYLRNRGDPYTLQKMLGHSTLDMVKRYLAIAQSDVEAAHKLASPVENWAL